MSRRHLTALAIIVSLLAFYSNSSGGKETDQDLSIKAYYKARKLLDQGKISEAAIKFDSVLRAYPDSRIADDAAFYLGYCWEKLGQKQRAFEQYRDFLREERFTGSSRRRMVLYRSFELAKELRQARGDEYDKFLEAQFLSEKSRHYRLESAIRLAQLGNWEGLETLTEGLKIGDDFQKIRIIELMRYRIGDVKVQEALAEALVESQNELIRMHAASILHHHADNEFVRERLTKAMLEDRNRIVRINALQALTPYLPDEKIEKAFEELIRIEKDPMIIRGAVNAVSQKGHMEKYQPELLHRIEIEEDPLVTITIVDGIRKHIEIGKNIEFVAKPLMKKAQPVVRMGAINLVSRHCDEPEVRSFVINALEDDPDVNVRITAVQALRDHTGIEEVRGVLLKTVRNEENAELISYSVQALSPQISVEEVRESFRTMLNTPRYILVADELVNVLAPQVQRYPDIQDTFLTFWEKVDNPRIKVYAANRVPRIEGDQRIARLGEIYVGESNARLVSAYYKLLRRSDPEKAEELAGQRPPTDRR